VVTKKRVVFDRKEELNDNQEKVPKEKMIQATKKESEILFRTKTVFPFDLFPDTITIHTTKIDIVQKIFFYSQDIMSISVKDIAAVEVQTAPFFATINIIPAPPYLDPKTIRYLKISDAIKIKKLIDKLLLAIKEDIDLLELDVTKFLADIK
jgi:hypothetical protein